MNTTNIDRSNPTRRGRELLVTGLRLLPAQGSDRGRFHTCRPVISVEQGTRIVAVDPAVGRRVEGRVSELLESGWITLDTF